MASAERSLSDIEPSPARTSSDCVFVSTVLTFCSVWSSACSDASAAFWLVAYCDSVADVIDSCTACAAPAGLSAAVCRLTPLEIC